MALDLMEEFRALIVDSAVVNAFNTGMLRTADFTVGKSGCLLREAGRKSFLRAFELRMDQLVTHPLLDYRVAWRVMIRLQARLLARWLRGDIPAYPGMTTR
ncbi:MAG: CRISPR-associated endonuclease Cas1 [Betaproteobacteria bacterium]|nr:CRISPR-associated endonuclease Cas1 [Betaproteobacteria bacterium]